jgi:hypothetical protein
MVGVGFLGKYQPHAANDPALNQGKERRVWLLECARRHFMKSFSCPPGSFNNPVEIDFGQDVFARLHAGDCVLGLLSPHGRAQNDEFNLRNLEEFV